MLNIGWVKNTPLPLNEIVAIMKEERRKHFLDNYKISF